MPKEPQSNATFDGGGRCNYGVNRFLCAHVHTCTVCFAVSTKKHSSVCLAFLFSSSFFSAGPVQGQEEDVNKYGIASSNFDIYHEYKAGESFHIDILVWTYHWVRCIVETGCIVYPLLAPVSMVGSTRADIHTSRQTLCTQLL